MEWLGQNILIRKILMKSRLKKIVVFKGPDKGVRFQHYVKE